MAQLLHTQPMKNQDVQDDLITQTSFMLGKISEMDASKMVHTLIDNLEFNYFKLGGVLHTIRTNHWYGDHGDFKTYVLNELGFRYHKANHLINIYTHIVSSGMHWDQIKHLGWTKMRSIAKLLVGANADTQQEWIDKAKTMTVAQLNEHINALKGGESYTASEEMASKVSVMTFKVHGDQKELIDAAVDKAKEEGHTDYDSVALTYIVSNYLGAAPTKATLTKEGLAKIMFDLGYKEVLGIFEEVFPDIDLIVKY